MWDGSADGLVDIYMLVGGARVTIVLLLGAFAWFDYFLVLWTGIDSAEVRV